MSFARSFNRNRPLHYLLAACVGVASGVWLFNEPLKRQAALRGQQEQAKQQPSPQ